MGELFDKIDVFTLWRKLLNNEISTKFVPALELSYNTVKSSIRYERFKLDATHSFVGIKQGDPASSLLCLLYLIKLHTSTRLLDNVNSRLDCIFNVDDINDFFLLFANDTALLAHDTVSLRSLLKYLNIF